MATIEELRALRNTPAQAGADENARKRLELLVKSGQASDTERREFERLQAAAPANQKELGETGAAYTGFLHDISLGLADGGAKEALEQYPEQFRKGQMAGSGALGGATMAVGAPALKGASWLTKTLAGAATGGGLAANQSVQESQLQGEQPDTLGGYLDLFQEDWKPIAVGAGLGGAAYPLAATAGAGSRGVARMLQKPLPGMGRKASRLVEGVADSAADSGRDIQRYLGDLTDEAMLADVPEIRGTAQGLASQGGTGGKRIARALTERMDNNAQRIASDMDANITGPDAAFDARRANAAERTGVWGPEYEAALGSTDRVGTDRIAALLASQQDAVGAPAAAMKRVGRDLGVQPDLVGPQKPVSAARAHNVRSNLSDDLSAAARAGRGKFGAQVGPVLNTLDETLDEVPGYAAARTGYANTKAMDEAIDFGTDALDSGKKTAVSPAAFKLEFDAMSEPQKDAVRKGVRGQVARIMGTARNDAAAAWGEFGKNWNAEKLRIVLGDEAAEPIIKRLKSEQVFSQTHGAVNAGSQTDFRASARKMLEPVSDETTGQQIGPIKRAKTALFDRPINAAVDSVLYGPRASKANLEIGNALAATGSDRDALVQALMQGASRRGRNDAASQRLSAIIEALLRSGGAASSGALVSD